MKAVVGGKGHNVSSLYVPLSATDFTPFAQQAKQAKPDVLYVAWAGATATQVWSALDQQGVFSSVDNIVTGLAERATYPSYGPAISKLRSPVRWALAAVKIIFGYSPLFRKSGPFRWSSRLR